MAVRAKEPKWWLLRGRRPVAARQAGGGSFLYRNRWSETVVATPFFTFTPAGGRLRFHLYTSAIYRRSGGRLEPLQPLEEVILYSDDELVQGVRVYRLRDAEGGAHGGAWLAVNLTVLGGEDADRVEVEVRGYADDEEELRREAEKLMKELCQPLASHLIPSSGFWPPYTDEPSFVYTSAPGLVLKPGESALFLPHLGYAPFSTTDYCAFSREKGKVLWEWVNVAKEPEEYIVLKIVKTPDWSLSLLPIEWRLEGGELPEAAAAVVERRLRQSVPVEEAKRKVEELREAVRSGRWFAP